MSDRNMEETEREAERGRERDVVLKETLLFQYASEFIIRTKQLSDENFMGPNEIRHKTYI